MKKLLTLRRYQRKQAGLSHNREWYIIDFLVIVFTTSVVSLVFNLIFYGIQY